MLTDLISVEEISKHNSPSDCWIVLDGQVWDMTEFAPSHPGGSSSIYRHAGSDATEAYSEIHAPSLIRDNLPPSRRKGVLDPSTRGDAWLRSNPSPSTSLERPRAGQPSDHENEDANHHHKPSLPSLNTLLNADDFEAAALASCNAKTWAFYSSAADDLVTRDANRSLYRRIWLRPRVLRNVRDVSLGDDSSNSSSSNGTSSILGCRSSMPIFIAPAAMAKLIHPDGELAIARAAQSKGVIQCISTNASYSASEIVEATSPATVATYNNNNNNKNNYPFFFQLYVDKDRAKTADLLQTLIQRHGNNIRAIFVTVDAAAAGKREADERVRADESPISPMTGVEGRADRRGGGLGRVMGSFIDPALKWEDMAWIRKQLPPHLPLVLKGVTNASDVRLAFDHGLEGVLLSNHGGRNLDTSPPAILTLLECHRRCPEVFVGVGGWRRGRGRMQILIDGGIRRGTDALKCLALGATAVGLGRPVLYATAYGQDGVEHLLDIMRDELEVAMRNCGVTGLDQIGPHLVNTGDLDHLVPATEHHPYVTDWRRWVRGEAKAVAAKL